MIFFENEISLLLPKAQLFVIILIFSSVYLQPKKLNIYILFFKVFINHFLLIIPMKFALTMAIIMMIITIIFIIIIILIILKIIYFKGKV